MNRDTLVAAVLIAFCGLAFALTFAIPEAAFSSMGAGVWPRFVLVILAVLTLIYLGESLGDAESPRLGSGGGLVGFATRYSNGIACFVAFGLFLVALPYFGLLLSGIAFIFSMLTALGRRSVRYHVLHLVIAVVTVVGLWAVFTFGLQVMLPEGRLLRQWLA